MEATYMDPQQRNLLEVTYECLQSSGTTMESISGSTTGVFVANFTVDYQPGQTRDPDYLHRYTATGSGATVMSNRISHVMNLHGPRYVLFFFFLHKQDILYPSLSNSCPCPIVSRSTLHALRPSLLSTKP